MGEQNEGRRTYDLAQANAIAAGLGKEAALALVEREPSDDVIGAQQVLENTPYVTMVCTTEAEIADVCEIAIANAIEDGKLALLAAAPAVQPIANMVEAWRRVAAVKEAKGKYGERDVLNMCAYELETALSAPQAGAAPREEHPPQDEPDLLEVGMALEAVRAGTATLEPEQPVHIWSGEHRLWWRANAAGYTSDRREAGEYTFTDAWERSRHCGPEKQIEYYPIRVRGVAAPVDAREREEQPALTVERILTTFRGSVLYADRVRRGEATLPHGVRTREDGFALIMDKAESWVAAALRGALLDTRVRALETVLREVEWNAMRRTVVAGGKTVQRGACPVCGGSESWGHFASCRLAAALSGTSEQPASEPVRCGDAWHDEDGPDHDEVPDVPGPHCPMCGSGHRGYRPPLSRTAVTDPETLDAAAPETTDTAASCEWCGGQGCANCDYAEVAEASPAQGGEGV